MEPSVQELMKRTYVYPEPSDPEFQRKIFEKREFYSNRIPSRAEIKTYDDVKEYRKKYCMGQRSLREQQTFLGNFINPDTPYKGCLVFHGTGVGKTCAGITIAEKFKPLVQKYHTKIYVLVSGPLIKDNWKTELLNCTGETYLKKQDASVYVAPEDQLKQRKEAINIALQYYYFMSYRTFYRKVLGDKIIERVTSDDKIKKTYRKTDEGEYERDIPIDRITNLNNTIIIVDEAHNLSGNMYGDALQKIIDTSYNLKVVLMTATPMKNLADDIVQLINFIRPKDSQMQRDRVFNSLLNHQMDFKEGGREYFAKMCQGYVSYMRGADPLTFAKRVEKGEIPKGMLFTLVNRYKMYPFQQASYDVALKYADEAGDSLDHGSTAVANFAFPGLSADGKSLIGLYGNDGLSTLRNQLTTHADTINKLVAKLLNVDTDTNFLRLSDVSKSITGDILKIHNLKYFSIKFYKAMKKINRLVVQKKGARTAFVYSNLVKVGIELFQEVLLQNGYLEFDENPSMYKISQDTVCYYCGKTYQSHQKLKELARVDGAAKDDSESSTEYEGDAIEDHTFAPATFIVFTGQADETFETDTDDKHRILRNIFNSPTNSDGRLIKLVLGSKVMNEGINLSNIAEVHILDAYYTLGRIDQVIGRAIRSCRHMDIINDKNRYPEVKVYKYVVRVAEGLSTEEDLYKKAELKYILIKKIERIMKQNSIDCPNNLPANFFPEEVEHYKNCKPPTEAKPGDQICPSLCDFEQCHYKCTIDNSYWDESANSYKRIPRNKLDYSTFTPGLAQTEINYIKEMIKEMYTSQFVYTLDSILKLIKDSYTGEKKELFDEFFAYKALDELIPITENDFNNFKDTMFDKFNRPGYIINVGKYYIFQPFDQHRDVPMYYRSTYDKPIQTQLSLHSYLLHIGAPMLNVTTDDEEVQQTKTEFYDYDSVESYYNSKTEFKYVGIIDKEPGRRKNKRPEELKDVFKIRDKRPDMTVKKRGTGIPTYRGSVATTREKPYLEQVAKYLNIPTTRSMSREQLSDLLRDKLLHLEKYARGKDKFTYIMTPPNHATMPWPYNLEDRVKFIKDLIKEKIKFKLDAVVKEIKDTSGFTFEIQIKHVKELDEFAKFLKSLNAIKTKDQWIIKIE